MSTSEKANASLIADLLQEIGNPKCYTWDAVSRLGALLPSAHSSFDAKHIVQGLQEYVTRLHCAEVEARKNSREKIRRFPEKHLSIEACGNSRALQIIRDSSRVVLEEALT